MQQSKVGLIDIDSTIAAVSTPPGVGGIAVIRVTGKDALAVADKVWRGSRLEDAPSHTVRLGTVLDSAGQPLDSAVATVFVAPRSFTGQNTVEFSVHGSKFVQRELLASLVKSGARLAQPGEFTRRAFSTGRLQLTQAEAVADIIASDSRAAHRLALGQLKGSFARQIGQLRDRLLQLVSLLELELDFSEEDVEFADRRQLRANTVEIRDYIRQLLDSFATGNAIRNGIPVAIVGPTNAGKSSLLNAIIQDDRAIVSDIHGTTRDTIEETVEIGDYLFRFIDTAGLRNTDDPIELLGIERSFKALEQAHIVIALIDLTDPEAGRKYVAEIAGHLNPNATLLTVSNKADIAKCLPEATTHCISAKTGLGVDALKKSMTDIIDRQRSAPEDVMVTNQRHAAALTEADKAVQRTLDAMDAGLPGDLIAREARDIIDALAEITGEITGPDILANIFSRFCIGK